MRAAPPSRFWLSSLLVIYVCIYEKRKNEFPSQHLSIIERESFHAFCMGLCCQAVRVVNNAIPSLTAQNLPSSLITELRNMFAFDNIPVLLNHNFLLLTFVPLPWFWGLVQPCQCCLHWYCSLSALQKLLEAPTVRGSVHGRDNLCLRSLRSN